MRSFPGKPGVLRLSYSNKLLKVSILHPFSQILEDCFSLPVDMSEGGYLAISGSAGTVNPDFHEVHSIKVFDPTFDGSNNLVEEAH